MVQRAAPLLTMALFLIALVASAAVGPHQAIPENKGNVKRSPATQLSDILFITPVLASETTHVELPHDVVSQ